MLDSADDVVTAPALLPDGVDALILRTVVLRGGVVQVGAASGACEGKSREH